MGSGGHHISLFACALEWKLGNLLFNGRAWEGNWRALIDNCIQHFFFDFYCLLVPRHLHGQKNRNVSRGSRLAKLCFFSCCLSIAVCKSERKGKVRVIRYMEDGYRI